jgi:hypothetical protein
MAPGAFPGNAGEARLRLVSQIKGPKTIWFPARSGRNRNQRSGGVQAALLLGFS